MGESGKVLGKQHIVTSMVSSKDLSKHWFETGETPTLKDAALIGNNNNKADFFKTQQQQLDYMKKAMLQKDEQGKQPKGNVMAGKTSPLYALNNNNWVSQLGT